MMTRKDYVVVSSILADYKEYITGENVFNDLVYEFCEFFAADNSNFKYDKFMEACNE